MTDAKLLQAIKRKDYIDLKGPDGEEPFNQSKTKAAIRSAWHYRMAHLNPDRPEKKETDMMLRGTLVHEMALEDADNMAVFDGRRQGKKWDDFKLKCEHEGKMPVTAESGTINYRDVCGAAESAKEALCEQGADADPECAILFQQHGLWCKALLDKLSADTVIFDLKVTGFIDERKFTNQALKPEFRYDYQMAWYEAAVEAVMGFRPQHVIIAVEPTYPYEWDVHTFCEEAMAMARKDVRKSIENLVTAVQNDDWSHPRRSPNVIVPQPYHYYDADEYEGAVKP